MKYFFHSLFVKDHRLLKFVFIIFASYLIFEEFYKYLVLRPTYTTNKKRFLGFEDFPEIILCPQPVIDVVAAKSRGYGRGVEVFFMGILEEGWNNTVTWSGNASEEVRKVYEEISILKSVGDCPFGDESIFWFKNDNKWIQEFVSFKLSRALFPFHTCCKVINPHNNSQNNPINGLQISFSVKNKPFESLKVFMADQLTSTFYDLHCHIRQIIITQD